ncbi:dihydrodipicolinate synthase family protein [Sulfuracidifex metallicus]|uniref:dihydrodipicolinate synthase family protein n=1 Tax=Sulfuracidifex metallicus TaxID=47303 RepID=UPI0022727690|nr:dihydrodipicolinate synthase family protein [Sulfuracidifex metallicus]MCY0850049.1 dihydrodipicolinate synthase family protein [Sulfuracidifex metallicus]
MGSRRNVEGIPEVVKMAEIIVPILTPFKENKIDKEILKEHASSLLKAGVDRIFVNGTTGMGPALSREEKETTLRAVMDVTEKVIFQIGGLNMDDVKYLAKLAKDLSVKTVASYAPYYFTGLPKWLIIKYFKEICEIHDEVYLYNYPSAVGKDVDAETVSEIGCIKGVKDTNDSINHSLQYKKIPGMKVFNGADTLVMTAISTGLDGTVSAAANFVPDVLVNIRENVLKADIGSAMRLQFMVDELVSTAKGFGYIPSIYVLTKELMGYDVGEPRPVLFPLNESQSIELLNKTKEIFEKYSWSKK